VSLLLLLSAYRAQAKPGFELKVCVKFDVKDGETVLGTGSVTGEELCDYDGYDFDLSVGVKADKDSGVAASDLKRPATSAAKALLVSVVKGAVTDMTEQ
jgi:hypothetical protein